MFESINHAHEALERANTAAVEFIFSELELAFVYLRLGNLERAKRALQTAVRHAIDVQFSKEQETTFHEQAARIAQRVGMPVPKMFRSGTRRNHSTKG